MCIVASVNGGELREGDRAIFLSVSQIGVGSIRALATSCPYSH